jgi:hypothetical protein
MEAVWHSRSLKNWALILALPLSSVLCMVLDNVFYLSASQFPLMKCRGEISRVIPALIVWFLGSEMLPVFQQQCQHFFLIALSTSVDMWQYFSCLYLYSFGFLNFSVLHRSLHQEKVDSVMRTHSNSLALKPESLDLHLRKATCVFPHLLWAPACELQLLAQL